jgi:ribosomal-protein-alanine N-acetyltransferase
MNQKTLHGRLCRLRPYRAGDEPAICAVADDFLVARWMTQRFPHPYTIADAQYWVAHTLSNPRGTYYAVEVDGILAGGIGIEPLYGERDGVAAFGYWLGRSYWGRGIATDAAKTLAGHALADARVRRLEASVFTPNLASARVLQKSGFELEGTLRAYYVDRRGEVYDALLYARLA